MSLKVAIITSTRAEYGLLYPLISSLNGDDYFELQLIVTGTHLLDQYGKTIERIQEDSVPIHYQVPIMEDGHNNVNQVIAKAITAFDVIYQREVYDSIIVLGDRYELYGFCIPAMLRNIPIVHIHGGEKTEGAVDERIRHSITKMASVHFPSIDEYAKRIIQMGENPDYVFPVGALGIDNIMHLEPMSSELLGQDLQVDFNSDVALVTFHPVTLDTIEEIEEQVRTVFACLQEQNMTYIVTMPNSDTGGEIATQVIMEYVAKYPTQFIFRKSLGQLRYLSVMHYAKMVIGNSSSGIIEAASFGIPTIDIGDRQQGRFAPTTVIHCECQKEAIAKAIEQGQSQEFHDKIVRYVNPYGDGKTALRMTKILKEISFDSKDLIKKSFYDINFEV